MRSSYGHLRDLKQKAFSIDIKDHFKPIYEIPEDKKKIVTELKDEARKADMVWLASDEDREGEAISWHLYEVLQLDPQKTKRIVFHEITKSAILKAMNIRATSISIWSTHSRHAVYWTVSWALSFHRYYGAKSSRRFLPDVYSRSPYG